jgi:uncharacterized protein (DUF433 family)
MSIDIGTFITRRQNILGGRPHIDGTRISVRSVVILYKRGYSPEEISDQLEDVSLAQVYAALSFYHANKAEIEADILNEQLEYNRLAQVH